MPDVQAVVDVYLKNESLDTHSELLDSILQATKKAKTSTNNEANNEASTSGTTNEELSIPEVD